MQSESNQPFLSLKIFISTDLQAHLLDICQLSLAIPYSHKRTIKTNRTFIFINIKVKLFLSWLCHPESSNDWILTHHNQIFNNVVLRKMTWNIFYKVTIRKLHHIFCASFLCLTTYVLCSWANRITDFVETLNTTNSKGTFLWPDFNSHDPWVRHLSDYSSISKTLTFISCQTFFIVFQVGLLRNWFLVWICWLLLPC